MIYVWTPGLRDALIIAELEEAATAHSTALEAAQQAIKSMMALVAIPTGSELAPTGEEVEHDGDVEPAPTWEWVDQLVQFYFGNGPLP